jgi:hypothetical protein
MNIVAGRIPALSEPLTLPASSVGVLCQLPKERFFLGSIASYLDGGTRDIIN